MASTVRRIDPVDAPVVTSPSGLPTRYLVDAAVGSTNLFVAEQTLRPGDRVLLHTHPVEEVLCFQTGAGVATIDEEVVPIGTDVTLYIPAGVKHGFENTGDAPLRVIVIFPGAHFAETKIVERVPAS